MLVRNVPRFIEMGRELAALPIPQTLVHGDLHLSNVSRQAGQYVLFDWTDACVSHPFFDMFLMHVSGGLDDEEWLHKVCLGPWRAWVDEATLAKTWLLSVRCFICTMR